MASTKSCTKSGGGPGKKMTMASALFGEKLAHFRADIRLGLYRLSHLSLPKEDRVAAEESNIVQKSVATGTLSRFAFHLHKSEVVRGNWSFLFWR